MLVKTLFGDRGEYSFSVRKLAQLQQSEGSVVQEGRVSRIGSEPGPRKPQTLLIVFGPDRSRKRPKRGGVTRERLIEEPVPRLRGGFGPSTLLNVRAGSRLKGMWLLKLVAG